MRTYKLITKLFKSRKCYLEQYTSTELHYSLAERKKQTVIRGESPSKTFWKKRKDYYECKKVINHLLVLLLKYYFTNEKMQARKLVLENKLTCQSQTTKSAEILGSARTNSATSAFTGTRGQCFSGKQWNQESPGLDSRPDGLSKGGGGRGGRRRKRKWFFKAERATHATI